jgi:hypothetical protein
MRVFNDQAIEAEIKTKGLNAPRLSPDKIDAVIVGEDYHVFPDPREPIAARDQVLGGRGGNPAAVIVSGHQPPSCQGRRQPRTIGAQTASCPVMPSSAPA